MSKMTISQALRRIKKLKGRLKNAHDRAKTGVFFYDEDPPAFSFGQQLEIAGEAQEELIELEAAVAKANATTTINVVPMGEVTLFFAIRKLAQIKSDIAFFRGLLNSQVRAKISGIAEDSTFEWDEETDKRIRVKIEKKWTCSITKEQQAKKIQDLEDAFEKLNNIVERANHETTIKIGDNKN